MKFLSENIRVDEKMDASVFEGLLYKIFSEEPFDNHKRIGDKTDDSASYLISEYLSS